MILVTGAAGFIGANIIQQINHQQLGEVVAVDDLSDGRKFHNLADLQVADYWDKDELSARLDADDGELDAISAVIHQGACSDTTQWDGRFMMRTNFSYSKTLLHWCLSRRIPLVYASSAAVYGAGRVFNEEPACEVPLNVYGYSKLLFDQYVRRHLPDAQSAVVGLRYFNVYGPREQHKGNMASVAWHFHRQLQQGTKVRLFEGADGYGHGEQRRDFVYVGDVAASTLWFLGNPQVSGIFNVGSGRSQTFNDVANAVIDCHGSGDIEYIPFPEHLKGHYQSYTQADLSRLRATGFDREFCTVEQGVRRYFDELSATDHR